MATEELFPRDRKWSHKNGPDNVLLWPRKYWPKKSIALLLTRQRHLEASLLRLLLRAESAAFFGAPSPQASMTFGGSPCLGACPRSDVSESTLVTSSCHSSLLSECVCVPHRSGFSCVSSLTPMGFSLLISAVDPVVIFRVCSCGFMLFGAVFGRCSFIVTIPSSAAIWVK